MSKLNTYFDPNRNKFESKWIKEKIDKDCIDYLQNFGFYLCDKKKEEDNFPGRNAVTTSQLRNIFSEVKRLEVKIGYSEQTKDKEDIAIKKTEAAWQQEETNFLLLRPKIAYNVARVLSKNRYSRMKDFRVVIEDALLCVDDPAKFKRFSQFLEGIVAYHKVYGGKD